MDGERNIKVCGACGLPKPLEAFRVVDRSRLGVRLDYRCKGCNAAATRLHYAKNAEKRRTYARDYYRRNKARLNAQSAERWRRLFGQGQKRDVLAYPYLQNDSGAGADVLMKVNAAVPATLPDDLRADVCQELVLKVLAGEIRLGEVGRHVSAHVAGQRKYYPSKYGPISLDGFEGKLRDRVECRVARKRP